MYENGKLPKPLKIVDTAGQYSKNIRATAFWQLLRSGVISDSSQFIGIDDQSTFSDNAIVETNIKNYGEGKKWHIPCESGKIQQYCLDHAGEIGFIDLDLQSMPGKTLAVLSDTISAMKGVKHRFGICLNSLFSCPWNRSEELVGRERTVEEAMVELIENLDNPNYRFFDSFLAEQLAEYDLMKGFWYDGTSTKESRSSCILGAYVFWKK